MILPFALPKRHVASESFTGLRTNAPEFDPLGGILCESINCKKLMATIDPLPCSKVIVRSLRVVCLKTKLKENTTVSSLRLPFLRPEGG